MSRPNLIVLVLASAGALVAGCATPGAVAAPPAAASPEVKPALLKVGDAMPADLKVKDVDGRELSVRSLYEPGPVVIIVYRGGWCPFCTRQMKDWNGRLDELRQAGASVVAISVEKPERVRQTAEKESPGYSLLIDDQGRFARAVGLGVLSLDESTRAKYSRYGIKLDEINTTGRWELPYPATLVIDKAGVVRFIEQSEDYTKRSDPAKVMDVVRTLKK